MNALNRQFELIRQSATVARADRILALKASGQPILGLQVGDPDFGTPAPVLEAAGYAVYAPDQRGVGGTACSKCRKCFREDVLERQREALGCDLGDEEAYRGADRGGT